MLERFGNTGAPVGKLAGALLYKKEDDLFIWKKVK